MAGKRKSPGGRKVIAKARRPRKAPIVKAAEVVANPQPSGASIGGVDYGKIVEFVTHAQLATQHIPAMATEYVRKAWRQMEKSTAERGPRAWFLDPFDTQMMMGWKERRSGFSFEMLKEVERQLAIVRAIINVRSAQLASFCEPYDETNSLGFKVIPKDRSRKMTPFVRNRCAEIAEFIVNCGQPRKNSHSVVKRDRMDTLVRKLVRDSLLFDAVAIEMVPDSDGIPYEFYAVDGTTIRFAPTYEAQALLDMGDSWAARIAEAHYDDLSYNPIAENGKPVKYLQIINNNIATSFTDDEMIYGARNPRSDIYVGGYGFSEIEQAITIVTALIDTEKYQSNLFKNGSLPRGLLNLKGTEWTQEQLECIPEDAAVYTDKGALPIRTVFDRQVSGETFRFWNGVRFADGFASESGEKEILNLRTADGMDFRCSPNHRMFVLTGNGLEERFASDLAPGDLLLENERPLDIEESPLSSHVATEWPAVSQGGRGVPFSIEEIGADLWEVIGWMVGDGWMSKNANQSLLFYHASKDIAAYESHRQVLAKYGVRFTERDLVATDNTRQIVICHKAFNQFLSEIGVGRCRDKQVPWLVFAQSSDKRGAFLRGLYSADGYVSSSGYSVGIFSKYPTLLEGIQRLLLTMGLPSYRVVHAKEYSQGDKLPQIFVRRREDFSARVGFIQEYKTNSIAPITRMASGPDVPVELLRKLMEPHRHKFSGRGERDRAVLSLWQKEHRVTSRIFWRDLLTELGDSKGAEVLSYRPVPIERIFSVGHAPTLDVTIVGDEPRFVAEGFLTHNSLKRQWSAQLQGGNNAHRMPIVQFDGDLQFVNLQQTPKDMEFNRYHEFLYSIFCGVCLIDPLEVVRTQHGGDRFEAALIERTGNEARSRAARDRGLKPMLRFFAGLFQQIVDKIDDSMQFRFIGLDEPSENEKHQRRLEELASFRTLDDVRNAAGLEPYYDPEVGRMIMSPTVLQAHKLALEAKMLGAQTESE